MAAFRRTLKDAKRILVLTGRCRYATEMWAKGRIKLTLEQAPVSAPSRVYQHSAAPEASGAATRSPRSPRHKPSGVIRR